MAEALEDHIASGFVTVDRFAGHHQKFRCGARAPPLTAVGMWAAVCMDTGRDMDENSLIAHPHETNSFQKWAIPMFCDDCRGGFSNTPQRFLRTAQVCCP